MAILQLSRITNRKGLQENLPQLAGAEFGWSLDEKRLWIGNGEIEDGAPIIGNTELLTEFSDVLALAATYTYKGIQAGYVITTGEEAGTPVERPLQSKFDELVSVKDFGAMGDGVTNDGPAINRAYYELFCRELNTEIRRALYFPAGIYITYETIKIPPHAKCYGDGITSSIIRYIQSEGDIHPREYVATTSDSNHQIGANLGNNSAITPTGIEMSSMSIESTAKNSVILLKGLTKSTFSFMRLGAMDVDGEFNEAYIDDLRIATDFPMLDILDTDNSLVNNTQTSAIKLEGISSNLPSDITFNKCITSGTTYGINVQEPCKGVQFENGKLHWHFKGADIGTIPINGGPTGVNITRSIFDDIADNGINFGPVSLNSSAFNIFYNVANNFDPAVPVATIINIESGGNVSIGDLFERNDEDSILHPRITLNGQPSIAFDNTSAMKLGSYERRTGLEATLPTGVVVPEEIFTIHSAGESTAFKVDYTIQRGDVIRMGSVTSVLQPPQIETEFTEEYTTSGDTGIVLDVETINDGVKQSLMFTNTSIEDALFKFSIVRLD